MSRRLKVVVAAALAALGLAAAYAIAGTPTTGTVTACATATSPAHTVEVDGTPVSTVAASTASQCATTTYTVPTVTETVTQTVTTSTTAPTTTTAPPPPPPQADLGTALPAPLPQSTGLVVTGAPSQSLNTLLNGLSAGNILELHAGSYGLGLTTKVDMTVSGTPAAPITVESYPGETATIRQLVKVSGSYVRFTNLTVGANSYPTDTGKGYPAGSVGSVGIWIAGSHDTLEHLDVHGSTMSGIFGDGSYNQLLYDHIHDCGTTKLDHGIYYGGDNSLIAGNVVEHNAMFGVQLQYSTAHDDVIADNTLVANGTDPSHSPGSGTVTGGGTSRIMFANNISVGNGEFGYKTYDAGIVLHDDDAFNNPGGAVNGSYTGATFVVDGLLTADPHFVSATDYHLASDSPLLGAGDPAYTLPVGIDGRQRQAADLGAY